MTSLFSAQLTHALSHCSNLQEIRIRAFCPIVVILRANRYYLTENGPSVRKDLALNASLEDIEEIVAKAASHSLYAKNDNVAQGFLIFGDGIRVGISGEAVNEKNGVRTFKNISSLCIRFPREVKGCSHSVYTRLKDEADKSCLILSPPGGGKTTMLRDLARQLSADNDVLLIDERYELSASVDGKNGFDVGECDVICGCAKKIGFENGARSMAPDVIIADEIGREDAQALLFARSCGVSVIAGIHARDLDNLLQKPYFEPIINGKAFRWYFVLDGRQNPGVCRKAYDESLRCIWERKG